MNTGLFMLLFSSTSPAQECEDLKRDMQALELFLQDQDDHEEFCPKLKWDQPDIEVYKKDLKSHLPANCKQE